MYKGRPSATALSSAMFRAAHLLLDDPPKILEDTLASRLCGFENETALRDEIDAISRYLAQKFDPGFAQSVLRYVRASAIMRSRYVEDELERAIIRGISQYVILGAGLDSFAYRRQELLDSVKVYEVDYPATQAWKRAYLQDLRVELPANLSFVPIDFEKQSFIEGLRLTGYHTDAPAVFSLLGVTMYLTVDAIFSILRSVASLATGTEIIFHYLIPPAQLDDKSRQISAVVMESAASCGEPYLSFFEPFCLAAQVRKLGFVEVWDVGPEQANACYFAGRTDGLRVLAPDHVMGARVGPPFA